MSPTKTPNPVPPRVSPPKREECLYAIGQQPVEPRPVPEFVKRAMREVGQRRVSAAKELPKPPRWPMLNGVLTFPFYLNTLGPWVIISLGLMFAAAMLMIWVGPGRILGLLGARLFGLPTCAAALLTFGYASTCCMTIMEATSNGHDSIEISPGIDWKEWTWNYAHIMVLLLQAALVGMVVRLVCFTGSWQVMIVGTFVAFPLVLMGALAADGAWMPTAIWPVLRSLVRAPGAWGLFYVQVTVLTGVWLWLTVSGLRRSPWVVPLYSAPFLAALILIYARLIGRLAGCIADTLTCQTEGDDDEDE